MILEASRWSVASEIDTINKGKITDLRRFLLSRGFVFTQTHSTVPLPAGARARSRTFDDAS